MIVRNIGKKPIKARGVMIMPNEEKEVAVGVNHPFLKTVKMEVVKKTKKKEDR